MVLSRSVSYKYLSNLSLTGSCLVAPPNPSLFTPFDLTQQDNFLDTFPFTDSEVSALQLSPTPGYNTPVYSSPNYAPMPAYTEGYSPSYNLRWVVEFFYHTYCILLQFPALVNYKAFVVTFLFILFNCSKILPVSLLCSPNFFLFRCGILSY